jgi:hypothetical protein
MPFLLAMSNFVSWIQVINATFERELITGIMRMLVLGLFIMRRMRSPVFLSFMKSLFFDALN